MSSPTSEWFKYLTEAKSLCEQCGGLHEGMCPDHDDDGRELSHHDREGKMAKRQLYKIMNYAKEIHDNLHDDDELESWVQSKIATMASMIGSVKHYLEYEYKKDMHSLMEDDND
jgi:hypothetical protein|tara:strand:+ start:814 stop:1155 length:342 start_codon:yes stop_codon:yes gene_type:complete